MTAQRRHAAMARRHTARRHDDGTATGQQRTTANIEDDDPRTTAQRERQKPAHGYQKAFYSRCVGHIETPQRALWLLVTPDPPIRRPARNRSHLVTPNNTTAHRWSWSTSQRPDANSESLNLKPTHVTCFSAIDAKVQNFLQNVGGQVHKLY